MKEESHETDCTSVVAGKECADRRVPLKKMCSGCGLYWTGAAKLAHKTPKQWISENVAEYETLQSGQVSGAFRLVWAEGRIELTIFGDALNSLRQSLLR
jgi:hypothetical protein